jgi:hypothetical protein
MSSYDCVLPVDWTQLTQVILPEWTRVLRSTVTIEGFCLAFCPEELPYFNTGLPDYDARNEQEWASIPREYLSEIGWSASQPIFSADTLRTSVIHQSCIQPGIAWDAMYTLCKAILNHAGVLLPGPDRFTDTPLHRNYGRLSAPPFLQIAGTKNGHSFLNTLYLTNL